MKFSKSPRINQALYNMGIYSYQDIILHLPRKYESLKPTHENLLKDKERVVFVGNVVGEATTRRFSNITVTKFGFVTKNKNVFYVEAWNRPYLSSNLKSDETLYTLVGNYDAKKNKINLVNITKGEVQDGNYIKPIYSLSHDIDNYEYIRLVKKAFEECKSEDFYNEIPAYFRKKYRLLGKYDALKLAHLPKDEKDIYQGLRVLKYEECLLFSLKTQMIRSINKEMVEFQRVEIDKSKVDEFINSLPFSLTKSQKDTVDEILDDLNKPNLMYRLLQGDVGTGKTLVALIALYANYLRGNQGAFMAPTDALARQHYKTFAKLLVPTGLKVALLLGSTPVKERAAIRNALINNQIDIIVGTHALFSKDIDYLSLGLAIIDEQHKFGVNQRMLLTSKGENADLLLMSATPIPRTLALTLYGDLDVSTLTDFPFKERKITTKIVENNDSKVFEYVRKSLENNKRVFVVAPMIIENEKTKMSVEKLFAKYLLKFPGKVSLLHGKLDQDDKNFALQDFVSGESPILISTSVIEVGIDVPNADLMIIYEPTHFGLASLHQLRGRIGRDGNESICLLITDSNDEEELEKLSVLTKSNDGFFIAEEDLKRRGPGELGGVRQSGIANFTYVNLVNDFRMFEAAREDAKFILKNREEIGFKHILNKANIEIETNNFTNA